MFLAWTTGDLAEEREKLRRELEARHYRVVPTGAPPLDAAGVRERVLAALRDARLAVHLVGALYGFVPEGEERSIVELQSDDAVYQASASSAARIFWLAPHARPQDARAIALIDRLQKPSSQSGRVDLLNQNVEALKTLVLDRLNPVSTAAPGFVGASPMVYLPVRSARLRSRRADSGFPVRPVARSQTSVVRRRLGADPRRALRDPQGVRGVVLLFWGKAKESWLRTMLRDLNKVFGLGRSRPYKAASLCLAELPGSEEGKLSAPESSTSFVPAPNSSPAHFGPSSLGCPAARDGCAQTYGNRFRVFGRSDRKSGSLWPRPAERRTGAAPASRRFLAVVGASGSGKSSLVRAGLLPSLERNHGGGRDVVADIATAASGRS